MKITIILLAVLTGASGCASSPTREEKGDPYSVLYDGKSTAAYATAFPVATPQEANANGDAAAARGDMDRALFEYVRSLKLDGAQPDTLYKIGAIHDSRQAYRLAGLAYRWAIKLDATHLQARTGLGVLLLRTRQYDAAGKELQAVVERAPNNWRAHNALGVIADLDGHAESASLHYEKALEASPGSARVLNNWGYSRYLAGEWAQARRILEKALRADPNYELAWRNLGLVHARLGDYERAVEALSKTMSMPEAYNDVGYLTLLEQDYAHAEALLQEAMRLSPSFYGVAYENAKRAQRLRQDAIPNPPPRR